ncbi:MAG: nucleotidyl transferase AbiEii/AbiGii toxin family protein [Candidatus Hinthialibacter antarcticus]|nr:nucleotidyl transferase AbiEii/AbiGii toxin family protein [Candidatus Hinthialibacter antarcticus]
MDKVAMLKDNERKEIFESSASIRGWNPAIIEKDFWVCWTLQKLFSSSLLGNNIVFKGGTSLSKVYHLIERFSEDIDLVLNWKLLGYDDENNDPWSDQPSNTQQNRFNQEVNQKAQNYLIGTFEPHLKERMASVPSVNASVSTEDELVINVEYPAAFDLKALRPEIKLEIGPLASWVPTENHKIQPYSAEDYPRVFENPQCSVKVIKAERSFWEKATILHQQAHRTDIMPQHFSRHYYDMYCLAKSPVKKDALNDLKLLSDVVRFKSKFYYVAWAKYEDAKVGTFKLTPTNQGKIELRSDYKKMMPMFFGDSPSWEEIMEEIQRLEEDINNLNGE